MAEYKNKRRFDGAMHDSSVVTYINELEDKVLTHDEELELLKKIESGDINARSELIKNNLRLVIRVAEKYVGRGLPFPDLIQEGNMGLIKAISKFDLNKGLDFSKYAIYRIRREITHALMNCGTIVRKTSNVYEEINRFKETETRLINEYGRYPRMEEIASELFISLGKAIYLSKLQAEEVSINTLSCDTEREMQDFLLSYENLPEDVAILNSMTNEVHKLIEMCELKPIEFEILLLRFGFYNNEILSFEEIGKRYGLSKQRIKQIEQNAISKIRKSKYIKDFAVYMDNPNNALRKVRTR